MTYSVENFQQELRLWEGRPYERAYDSHLVHAALRIAERVMTPGVMERAHRNYAGVDLEPEDAADIATIRAALTGGDNG